MSSHFISEWPAPVNSLQSLRQKLLLAGFSTAHEVLALSNTFLRARLPKSRGISDDLLDHARTDIAAWVTRSLGTQTVWEACTPDIEALQDARGVLSTGETKFDELLRGGLRVGVTELVGEASSGKTQLCIQLCLQVQRQHDLGGFNAGAYYMASESTFPTRRAIAMAQERFDFSYNQAREMLEHIHLTPAESFEDLEHFALVWSTGLAHQLNNDPIKKPLGLLVIDSLAAPIRTEYTNDSAGFRQRGNDLNGFGERLKRLAHQLQICVVVVNQVSEIVQQPGSQLSFKAVSDFLPADHRTFSRSFDLPYTSSALTFASHPLARAKQAALGLVWANQVDTRLCLLKSSRRTTGAQPDAQIRHLCVIFSPFSPSHGTDSYVDFIIQPQGLVPYSQTVNMVKRLKSLPVSNSSDSPSEPASVSISSTQSGARVAGTEDPADEEHMWNLLDQDVDLTQIDMEVF